jgi:molybdopterin molybdotransferase
VISFEEACSLVMGLARPLGAERVSLDRADGRVLAEDLVATAPLPAFDHSAMDGYALATGDLSGEPPFALPVRGTSAAGPELSTFVPGSAMRIYTGARTPPGADAVIMQEDVERTGEGDAATIRFSKRPTAGANIRYAGSDLRAGAVALARGRRLGPGQVALAAALDRPTLLVGRRPVVAVLGSGDELRSPGEPARPGSVVESNGYFVASAARRAGAIARVLPFMGDELELATDRAKDALRGVDLLVTIGGVSVGDRDVVRPALEAAGVHIELHKVAMKPGKPITFGTTAHAVVLGLPGNPASASLTFLVFGVPLIRALAGESQPAAPRRVATVRGTHRRKPGRTELVRARLGQNGEVELLPNQASGAVTSFAEADVLVVVPAAHGDVVDGEALETLRIAEIFG